jgi:transposase
MLFERFAIDVMLACQTVKGAQGILRTSWDETWHILKKAVARGKARKTDNAMPRIGIDEKAFRKGQSYITMIYDLDNSTVEAIYSQELETGKAWAYKEMLGDLWHHDDAASATVFFKDWYKRVIHTKLTPLKKVAQTIRDRLVNVVSYCTHGITNAVAEGMNSKIMSIKRRVGGYRHRENFKTAIYFHCGGLDLYPR